MMKKNSKPIEGWREELKILNRQIAEAKKERKEDNKHNILIASGVAIVCVVVLLIVSL